MNATRKRGGAGRLLTSLAGAGSGGARSVVPVILLTVVAVVGAWYAWKRWGSGIVSQTDYVLASENISITPQPAWIHSDIKAEVIRDADLADLRILDPDLALRIQQAFSLHAWVADVRRVRKRFPPQVIVDLEYRRPVAMIKAVSGGYWPVDSHGVLLPPEEFSPQQTRHYLRVVAENSQPSGLVGTPYGDARVAGAARIADLLAEHRDALGLDHLIVRSGAMQTGVATEPTFEINTVSGTRIIWGRSPGHEGAGEVTGSDKVARLLAFHTQRAPVNTIEGPAEIDLRDASGIGIVPRSTPGDGPDSSTEDRSASVP